LTTFAAHLNCSAHDHTASITAVDEVIIPEGWAVPGNLVVVGLGPRSLEEGDTGALAVRIIGARQPVWLPRRF
jgi:hypothetical protein